MPSFKFQTKVLRAYRQRYTDFGPTLASEKLADEKLIVCPETLRTWLLAEGLGCGNASGSVIRIAAVGPVGAASANWCRWTRRSTTGWRDAAKKW